MPGLEDLPVEPSKSQILRRLLEMSPYALCISDYKAEGLPVIYANSNFYDITGYNQQEVVGRNCKFLQGEDSDASVIEQMREALKLGQGCSCRILNYDKAGTKMWNDISLAPIRRADGEITHYIGVLMLKKAPSFRPLYRRRTRVSLMDEDPKVEGEGDDDNSSPTVKRHGLTAKRISRPSGMSDEDWIQKRRARRQAGECTVQPDVNAWMTLVRRTLDPKWCPSWAVPLEHEGLKQKQPDADYVIAAVAGVDVSEVPMQVVENESSAFVAEAKRERMTSSQM
ncbi:hypothetical protein CYMTET_44406 [Cymbomonas tetramitiformis]|uniref:PAS domain-containing protein n=1 Tax=Cymbomonas tetramitiformis TaxID=36881 RepID=A0AAE0C085_9CHLO|nr:hypothetical protein CYMTET_44406 [Cymbomonas tetramitiformis]